MAEEGNYDDDDDDDDLSLMRCTRSCCATMNRFAMMVGCLMVLLISMRQ